MKNCKNQFSLAIIIVSAILSFLWTATSLYIEFEIKGEKLQNCALSKLENPGDCGIFAYKNEIRQITIKNTSEGPNSEVFFLPFKTSSEILLTDLAAFDTPENNFKTWGEWSKDKPYNGGRWVSQHRDDIITWKGNTKGLSIPFVSSPNGGKVAIYIDGKIYKELDLHSESTGWPIVVLPENHAYIAFPYSFFKSNQVLTNNSLTIEKVNILAGSTTIYSYSNPQNLDHKNFTIFYWWIQSAILIFIKIVLLSGFIYLIGAIILGASLSKYDPLTQFISFYTTGIAVIITFTSSVVYYFSTTTSLILLLSILLILLFFRRSTLQTTFSILFDPNTLQYISTGIGGFLILYANCIREPNLSLGHSFSDFLDYTGWAFELSQSKFYFGMGPWRVSDLCFPSFVVSSGISSPIESISIIAGVFLILTSCLSGWIGKYFNFKGIFPWLLSVLITLSATNHGLFERAYFAHLEAQGLVFSILCISILWWEKDAHENLSFDFILGITLGAITGVYPYLTLGPFALGIVVATNIIYKRDKASIGKFYRLILIALIATLAANKNLWILFDLKAKNAEVSFLNLLTRNILYPYLDSFKFISVLFGVVSSTNTGLESFKAALVQIPLNGLSTILLLPEKFSDYITVFCCFFTITGLFLLAKKDIRSGKWVYIVTSLLYLIISIHLYYKNEPYAYTKFTLTLTYLLLIAIVKYAESAPFGKTLLCFYIFLNLLTNYSESIDQILYRRSITAQQMSSHISAISPEIAKFKYAMNQETLIPQKTSISFFGNEQQFIGTDKDRIRYQLFVQSLYKNPICYLDKQSRHFTHAFSISGFGFCPPGRFDINFGDHTFLPKTDSIIFEGDGFSIVEHS